MRLFAGVTSIEKSISQNSPFLFQVCKEQGTEKTEAYLKLWLINLNESLNLKRPLSEDQIDETAFNIVQDYKNLTISDINLIFTRAKKGFYGEFYESISMSKIMSFFNKYFEERMVTYAEMYRNRHSKIVAESNKQRSIQVHEQRSKEQGYVEFSHKLALDNFTKGLKND
jgi:hypothetical protein